MANEINYEIEDLSLDSNESGMVNFSFKLLPLVAHDINVYFEYYIQFMKNNTVIKVTKLNLERIKPGNSVIGISRFENFHKDNIPDSLQLVYREFLKNKSTVFDLECPPEINEKGGAFTLNTPKKGFFGGEKWKAGTIDVKSVVLCLESNSLSYILNLVCKNPLTTIAEVISSNSEQCSTNLPIVIPAENYTTERENLKGAENLKLEINEYRAQKWVMSLPNLEIKRPASGLLK